MNELAAERQSLAQGSADLEIGRHELEQRSGQLQIELQELAQRRDALAAQRQSEAEMNKANASRTEQLSQLEQRERELNGQLEKLHQDQQQFTAGQNAWHEERRRLEAELEQHVESIDKAQNHVDEERRKLEQQRAELKLDRRKLDESQCAVLERSSESDPSSLEEKPALPAANISANENAPRAVETEDDIFARLRALSLVKESSLTNEPKQVIDDRAKDTDTKSGSEQPEPKPDQAAPASAAHEHEESIEDYMVRLLQRVRGPNAEVPAVEPIARPKAPVAESPPQVADDRAQPVPTKIEPRSSAPENIAHLAAMREIANLSTRTAIATHSFRRRSFHTWRMLGIAVSVAIAGALLIVLAVCFHSPLIYLGAATVSVAFGTLGWAAYMAHKTQLLKEAHDDRLAATREAPVTEPVGADSPLPAQPDRT